MDVVIIDKSQLPKYWIKFSSKKMYTNNNLIALKILTSQNKTVYHDHSKQVTSR